MSMLPGKPRLFYFECRVCGYDSAESGLLTLRACGLCPLCLDDCRHHNELAFRPATPEEIKSIKRLVS
jgi:hypothetical protein